MRKKQKREEPIDPEVRRKALQEFEFLFRKNCATPGCDRRRAINSRFCGCCQENALKGYRVVWRGNEPLSAVGERNADR